MGLFSKKVKKINIYAPVDGKVIKLSEIPDEVFSEGMLGDGFGILPAKGNFVTPVEGKLVTVFPTGHAYGIKHQTGVEILLHVGIDTVSLEGKGFEILTKIDDVVSESDKLCDVDLDYIEKTGTKTASAIIFLKNSMENRSFELLKTGDVKQGEIVAVINA